jgi:ParB-like chromosome segregation protein Spo0J
MTTANQTTKNGETAPPSLLTYPMVSPFDVTIVGIDEEKGNTKARFYDERIHLRVEPAFQASIDALGVHTPIILRREGNKLYVIDGRMRVRAARAAKGFSRKEPMLIPFIERSGEAQDAVDVMINANEARKDDPVDIKIAKLQRYLKQREADGVPETTALKDAALVFNVELNTIKNWLRLAKASEAVQKAVKQGKIAPAAAFELAKLPPEKQDEMVKEAMESAKPFSARQAAHKVRAAKDKKKDAKKDGKPATSEPAYDRPGFRVLTRLVEAKYPDDKRAWRDSPAFHMARYVLGLCPPSSVPGLTEALKVLESQAAKKTEEAAPTK